MRRTLLIWMLILFLFLAGSAFALRWDQFRSIELIGVQIAVLKVLGYEYAKESAYKRDGFQDMFLHPRQFQGEFEQIMLSEKSSAEGLALAGELMQCQDKEVIYLLAAKLKEKFPPEEAAFRLRYMFAPSPVASTYVFRSPLPIEYINWLEFIVRNHRGEIFANGLESYLAVGRVFYSGTNPNPDAEYYPLIVCPEAANVADIYVRQSRK